MPYKPASKLKYCPICHQVWEIDTERKKILIHRNFPSYGLQRDACSECKDLILGELSSEKTYVD